MIEYREDPGSNVIEILVDGGISREEFDQIAARLEAQIARHGKVRLLEEIRSFGGIEPAAFWGDLKFSLRHLTDFSRCAVVTDQRWIEWVTRALDPLLSCEIRHFPPAQIEAARHWLREDVSPASSEPS